jgi:hypothetical protein
VQVYFEVFIIYYKTDVAREKVSGEDLTMFEKNTPLEFCHG